MKQTARRLCKNSISKGAALGATLLLCLAALLAAAPAALAAPYIVVLNDGVAHPANVAKRHEENRGADIEHVYRTAIEGYSAELTAGELKAIKQDPTVDYVEADQATIATAQYPSTAIPRVDALTNPRLDIDEKEDAPINADIAILDSGIAPHHDLNIAGRTDCVGSQGSCLDGSGIPVKEAHGTHVAGIAAARDNGEGVVGAAPGARLWSVRVLDDSGVGWNADTIAGIDWVTAHAGSIEVANMCIGCRVVPCALPQAEHEALSASIDAGVVYVVAAGNNAGNAALSAPGSDPQVITVSAITDYNGTAGGQGKDWCEESDLDDWRASYSNFGAVIDIAAPGSCIRSTWVNGEYAWRDPRGAEFNMSGTSMAAPMVAGAAAVMASYNNPDSRAEVEGIRNALRSQGTNNWNDNSGDGIHEPLLNMSNLVPPATKPVVSTNPAGEIGFAAATLSGWVNPHGSSTSYYFQYGKTTSYGNTYPVPAGSVGSGTSAGFAWNKITNFEPGTTYHYRIVASNVAGTSVGTDQEFSTAPLPVPASKWALASGGTPNNPNQWVYYQGANGQIWQDNWFGSKWTNAQASTLQTASANTTPAALAYGGTANNPYQVVYYHGSDHQLRQWFWNGSSPGEGFISGQPMAANTSPTALASGGTPNNPNQWVYYQGANGHIWQDNWFGSKWINAQASTLQTAAANTSPTALASGGTANNPKQWVYYHGADHQIWQWYWNGSSASNGFISGQPVAANTSPVALSSGTNIENPNQWVYYQGANGQIWQSNWFGSKWINAQATTYPATPGTSPAAVAYGGTLENPYQAVYYVGSGGQIWQWFWNGTSATNGALGAGQPAATGASPTALTYGGTPNNPYQVIYYRGQDGRMWQWFWNGTSWINGAIN